LQLLQDIFIVEYFKSNPHGLKKENLEKEFEFMLLVASISNYIFLKKKHFWLISSRIVFWVAHLLRRLAAK
jgi:hypothetical protein